ncbi:hypothetical protein IWX90DRAFT_248884 [Phyllosticta citrichinensis]|uniref:Fibronectin type-III domain-containing protein n=1 Tax=Phyllosticta citrichinensis TaxID=1130410 RepID=A0ABR1XQW2_9PEZI
MPSPDIIAHWPVRAAGMEPLDALTSAPSLKALATFAALLWLVYRTWKVMAIKEDDLIKLLGLDVPAAPVVSLVAIKADGAVLHWELSEPRSAVQAYQIKVNGVLVEEVGPKDTSINVTNLRPATAFTVRVVAINHHNFHTQSEPVRFRTKPPSSDDFFDFAAYQRAVEIAHDDDHEEDENWWVEAKVAPCKNFLEPPSPALPPADMVRSHSNSQSHPRRVQLPRRISPATVNSFHQDETNEDPKSGETEVQLQAEGDRLRADIATTRKAIEEEERNFKEQKEVYSQRHNELKDELARKTAASSELRKEVVNLEKENQRSQAKKAAEEKALQQKAAERKKMADDAQRFKTEIDEMVAEIDRTGLEKEQRLAKAENETKHFRENQAEELAIIRTLEESVREIGIQNRVLEEERKKLETGEADPEAQRRTEWAKEEKDWGEKIRALQQRYQVAWAGLQTAERTYAEAQNQLQVVSARASNQPNPYRQPPILDEAPSRRTSQRQRQHAGSLGNENFSAAPGTFPVTTSTPYSNPSIASISPTVTSSSPFFNFANGAAPITAHRESSFSAAEFEALTGGAPMSPNAGLLLPSDLFSSETDRSAYAGLYHNGRNSAGSFGNLTGPPGGPPIPGLGAIQAQEANQSPSSPISTHSQSPSYFASPRGSSGQLHMHYPQEGIDSDTRSINSLSGSGRGVTGATIQSRFNQLFNRQRGKTVSDDGPVFGSLKSSQSHSLPRPEHEELPPIGAPRRRGSHSGSSWMESIKPFRTSVPPLGTNSPSHVQTRKRAFKFFPSKEEESAWPPGFGPERSSSPRPGSTKSFSENQLPRPSTESSQRFGWTAEPTGQRSSPLSAADLGINAALSSMNSFSRQPSRRPSVQHGPPGLGYDESIDHEFDYPQDNRSPQQAPIGTRPQSQPQPAPSTPPSGKLNPAAPNFKSLWTRSADKAKTEKEKVDKKNKGKSKAKEPSFSGLDGTDERPTSATDFAIATTSTLYPPTSSTGASDVFGLKGGELSPTLTRKSRDSHTGRDRSSTVASSVAETASLSLSTSWSPRPSLDRTESRSESVAAAGTSVGKESWMSKLSRKSSSSKFSLPGTGGSSGEKKGGFFSRSEKKNSSSFEDADDGDGASTEPPTPALCGSSAASSPAVGVEQRGKDEKKADRSSGLSWSSFRKKRKTASLAESLQSEKTEEDEREREREQREDNKDPEGLGVFSA